MITIKITEEVKTYQDMVSLLEEIAIQIDRGCTSGYHPNWALIGEEEKEDLIGDDEW